MHGGRGEQKKRIGSKRVGDTVDLVCAVAADKIFDLKKIMTVRDDILFDRFSRDTDEVIWNMIGFIINTHKKHAPFYAYFNTTSKKTQYFS